MSDNSYSNNQESYQEGQGQTESGQAVSNDLENLIEMCERLDVVQLQRLVEYFHASQAKKTHDLKLQAAKDNLRAAVMGGDRVSVAIAKVTLQAVIEKGGGAA